MSELPSPPRARAVLAASGIVALVVFAAHFAFAEAIVYPVPAVHDEFAYLLMGDTFAAGRLTNPTHPFWPHFETFHVFHQPVYQGKYPPGQGAFLALGQVLGGHPAVGVWLSLALGAGALCWMLAAWLPLAWALLGCLLFAFHSRVLLQWGQSYWGGAASLLGGALLFGGVARAARAAPRGAWPAAVGLFVLANTRPQEGLIAALLCLPLLAAGLARATGRERRRLLGPLALAVGVTLAWTAYYDWRLTGDALQLPHDHWRARNALDPLVRSYRGSLERTLLGKLRVLQGFFVGDALWAALPFLVLRRRSREVRFAACAVLLGAGFSIAATRAFPRYLSPLAGPMVFLLVEALRGLGRAFPSAPRLGRAGVVVLVAAHLALSLRSVALFAGSRHAPAWALARQAGAARLEELDGRHLVLVSYPPGHDTDQEWVYNAADIEAARVVWARSLGPERDRALIEHFAGRRAWSLRAEPPYELVEIVR